MMTGILLHKFRRGTPSVLSKDDSSHTSWSEDLGVASKQAEADCLREIQDFFRNFGVRLPKEKVFRYACFHGFDAEKAIEGIREDNYNSYLQLRMEDLEDQFLESNSVFPVAHLKSRKNSEVVYMRPSRFNSSAPDKVIESLCYVLNDLSRTEEQCRNGVTVIADMQNLSKENLNKEDCKKLIEALQGELVPTRVDAFLIVSAPSWFNNHKIWKWMKSAMSKEFAKKVHLIKEDRVSDFLMGDYDMYLPNDFCLGLASATEISEDYVDLKMVQDQ